MVRNYQENLSMTRGSPWDSTEQLHEWYVEEGMTIKAIAEEVGTSTFTVHKRLSQAGIARRGCGVRTLYPTFRTNLDGYEEVSGTHHTVPLHRLIAVAEWGFDAVKNRDVDHIDGCTFHNAPGNLQLLYRSEHTKIHHLRESLADGQTKLNDFE
jgi:hypothetical protein